MRCFAFRRWMIQALIGLICLAVCLPAPPAQAAGSTTLTVTFQAKVFPSRARACLKLINDLRKGKGLPEFIMLSDLEKVAIQRAAEIFVFFDHDRPNLTSYLTAYKEYPSLTKSKVSGESISAGFPSATAAFEEFQGTKAHLDNLLDKDFTHVGIACVQVAGSYNGYYWVLYFQQQPEGIRADIAKPKGAADANRTMTVDIKGGMFSRADKSHGTFELRTANLNLRQRRNAQPSVWLYDRFGVKIGKCQPEGLTFSSSNTAIFTVGKSGTLTRKKAGSAALTMKAPGLEAVKATVTVGGGASNGRVTQNRTSVTADTIGAVKPVLTATAYAAHSTLSAYVKGASGYVLYRATAKNGDYRKVEEAATTRRWSLKLETGDNPKTYYYKIRAYKNSGGKRAYSEYSTAVKARE